MISIHKYYVEVKKHGTHDQQSHAGGRGGGVQWDKKNNFQNNFDEKQENVMAYRAQFAAELKYDESGEITSESAVASLEKSRTVE